MSFSGCTPEALLPRSDSKNPATTCKGITSNGRPCRRALAASSRSSPTPSPSRGNGVLAVLGQQDAAAAFFCWQHKDQAEQLAARDTKTSLHPLKEKSSIDTLIERVGILELDESVPEHRKRHHRTDGPRRRDTLPSGWNEMPSPLMTVPEEIVYRPRRTRPSPPRSNVKLSWACCIQGDDDDLPPPRRRDRGRHSRPSDARWDPVAVQPAPVRPQMREKSSTTTTQPRPSPAPSSQSRTQTLLSIIPPQLSPQTTSLLLAELSRPITSANESGYIYIFWLTPESEVSKPDDETASSLLDDDEDMYTPRSQRTNQALARYASVRRPQNQRTQRTITLKIGRAANVHRRMSQWTKQCGQNITLIRYYPYASDSGSCSGGKVPHVQRVERLIHLELAERRVIKSECEQCGREHREWFEIEASRNGLKGVDEVVRRWVAWAERQ